MFLYNLFISVVASLEVSDGSNLAECLEEKILMNDEDLSCRFEAGPARPALEENWELTGHWLERARRELSEDPSKTPTKLQALKDLLQGRTTRADLRPRPTTTNFATPLERLYRFFDIIDHGKAL